MKLIIDRKIWLRGEGSEVSYLLRASDRKKCCVGILCDTLGVPEYELLGKTDVFRLMVDRRPETTLTLPDWMCVIVRTEEDICQAYHANDDQTLSEKQREDKITEIFARHDIQVEFIN